MVLILSTSLDSVGVTVRLELKVGTVVCSVIPHSFFMFTR